MLSLATGLPRASLSFEEDSGMHGNYEGADGIFYVEADESRGMACKASAETGFLVQRLGIPPEEARSNITALGLWVSERRLPNTCGLILVEEFFPRSLEPVWQEMQRLFHPNSPAARALRSQLLYSRNTFNIAVHVRVGDMIPTPLSYFAPCLRNVLAAMQTFSFRGAVDVWLFSDSLSGLEAELAERHVAGLAAELAAVAEAFPFFPARLRLEARNASALLTFMYLTEADVFIASDSTFSYMASYMSTKPVVIVAPEDWRFYNFRSYLGDRQQHILADKRGALISNTSALKQAAVSFFLSGE